MKPKSPLYLLLLLIVSVFAFQSCGDDEASAKNVLLVTNRVTGKFYTVNTKTGQLSEKFAIKYNGDTLKEIRSIVYHPGEKAFYVSLHSYADIGNGPQIGMLFKVDKKTKAATMINDNDGDNTVGGGTYDVWDAIVSWAVDSDDSLIAVGDFNNDGNGFVKFGTNGDRSLKTVEANVCCGLGMIYDADSHEALLGNDPNDGTVYVERFNTETGASIEDFEFDTFEGFPVDFNAIYATSWMPLKGLAKLGGTYYGLLYNDETDITYFISLNFEDLTVTYISTLGINDEDQYNALTVVSDANF